MRRLTGSKAHTPASFFPRKGVLLLPRDLPPAAQQFPTDCCSASCSFSKSAFQSVSVFVCREPYSHRRWWNHKGGAAQQALVYGRCHSGLLKPTYHSGYPASRRRKWVYIQCIHLPLTQQFTLAGGTAALGGWQRRCIDSLSTGIPYHGFSTLPDW